MIDTLKMIAEDLCIVRLEIGKEFSDGCEDCNFMSTESWEMPCKECKRNHKDYWRAKKVE